MDFSQAFTYPAGICAAEYARAILRLEKPSGRVDVVLDTDTYNEVDDQYAIAYLLASESRVRLQAIFAAPFCNHHAATPEFGMEKSHEEILRILALAKRQELANRVFRGANRYLPDEKTPVESDAARALVRLAMEHTEEKPLYVACIASPTNVASALLMEPEIVHRLVVIWSGGVSLGWPDCQCFNGGQCVAASRVLLESGVPLVLTPGRAMADHLYTTGPELRYWLAGKSPLCDFLVEKTVREAEECGKRRVWSRPLTDVVPAAWLMEGDFLLDRFEKRPTIEYDLYYSFDPRRPMMRYVYYVKRDALLEDLFDKLASL